MGREAQPDPGRESPAIPNKVLAAALRLKSRQRAALADRLDESLPPDPGVLAAWA